jgi:membrane protein implicated in regulation of membrane protease activity
LTGGIFSLKRKYFALSIIGMYLVFVSGVATMIAFALAEYSSWVTGLPFGLPVVILSILSVVFTSISKGEFV